MVSASYSANALDAGVSEVVRAINAAIGEIDLVFLDALQSKHGVPEWHLPAPMHLAPYDI